MTLRRATPSPPPPGATDVEASSDLGPGENLEELPLGVEPWSGEEMPTGTASTHDQLAALDELAVASDPGPSGWENVDLGVSGPVSDDVAADSTQSLPVEPEPDPTGEADELNYREIYETRFRVLDLAQREGAARSATGGELFALCLDPAPQVVGALLDNPRFGLAHARSLAQHHPSDRGLEILSRRAGLVRDSHVQRRLLQNPQAPDVVLDRVLRQKRLVDVYRSSIDRDLPERNRVRVRSRLRPIFTRAEPEDRVALIMKTEGRCLANLSGCTFDSRTTQVLCSQTIASATFIQNLARFPATPPALIAKLLRSPAVQRQPPLRMLLMKHPNAGGDKRRG